jgi:hypothetical protein
MTKKLLTTGELTKPDKLRAMIAAVLKSNMPWREAAQIIGELVRDGN